MGKAEGRIKTIIDMDSQKEAKLKKSADNDDSWLV